MGSNIILIGFMGTGKSTVGKHLARILEWEFIDTDLEVEATTGMSIPEIFRRHGETRFRSEEALVVQRLLEREKTVIATGGGTILNRENRMILDRMGWVISLYAPIATVLERVGSKNDRPLLKKSMEEIKLLWQSRQPQYNQADYVVDTTDKGIEEVGEEILEWVRRQSHAELV